MHRKIKARSYQPRLKVQKFTPTHMSTADMDDAPKFTEVILLSARQDQPGEYRVSLKRKDGQVLYFIFDNQTEFLKYFEPIKYNR